VKANSRGADERIANACAAKLAALPLPTTLAGISVTLSQSLNGSTVLYRVPLFGVDQLTKCADSSVTPDCLDTFITVQIPFEMAVPNPPLGQLVVSQGGTNSSGFRVIPATDNIHVITSCDMPTAIHFAVVPCQAQVTHADGTLVSAASPAIPGEVVVIYAWGLGQTTPAVITGEATPPAPIVSSPFATVDFNFRPNAVPTSPLGTVAPLFVGLTAGEVGLYQINVQIPDAVPGLLTCQSGGKANLAVYSNLTINIGGLNSFDGAPICVQPSP
jgi:uncharacterized protein (TIGR03437 family)